MTNSRIKGLFDIGQLRAVNQTLRGIPHVRRVHVKYRVHGITPDGKAFASHPMSYASAAKYRATKCARFTYLVIKKM